MRLSVRLTVLLLLAPLLSACSAAYPAGVVRSPLPESSAMRVSGDGDVRVLALSLQPSERGLQLAGTVLLRWPLIPSHRTLRVVARNGEGVVVANRIVLADPRPATLRHKSGRETCFNLELQDVMTPGSSIRSVHVSVPALSKQ
jgi:hypothetical protein